MDESSSMEEVIQQARARLEERFASFEQALLRKARSSFEPEREPGPPAGPDPREDLEASLESLRQDSEAKAEENRELLERIEELEKELKGARESAPASAPEEWAAKFNDLEAKLARAEEMIAQYRRDIQAKNDQLKEQRDLLVQIRSRREQSKKSEATMVDELERAREELAFLRDESKDPDDKTQPPEEPSHG